MTTTTTTSPQPEQGQMVSVRSGNWMVTDVSTSTLPPERLQTGLELPQHLITLSSVEDDGLGEELNVIWELEPGARVVEKVALPEPTGFDFWGVSSSADLRRSDETGFNHHLVKPTDFMRVKEILASISEKPT